MWYVAHVPTLRVLDNVCCLYFLLTCQPYGFVLMFLILCFLLTCQPYGFVLMSQLLLSINVSTLWVCANVLYFMFSINVSTLRVCAILYEFNFGNNAMKILRGLFSKNKSPTYHYAGLFYKLTKELDLSQTLCFFNNVLSDTFWCFLVMRELHC